MVCVRGHYYPSRKAFLAECKALDLEHKCDWLVRRLRDVVYDHSPADEYHEPGAEDTTFADSEVLGEKADDDDRMIVAGLLKLAEKAGAVRALGNGRWTVTAQAKLYKDEFKGAEFTFRKSIKAVPLHR